MTTFQFVGGHLDHVPQYAENMIKAVGIATLNWARLEQQLDALLVTVNKPSHSTEQYGPTPSSSFRRKIEMFDMWFVRDPRFEGQRDRAVQLTKAFTLAADDRNLLTHSNVQQFIEGPPVKMVVLKTVINGDELRIERGEWSEDQVFNLARALNWTQYMISRNAEVVSTPTSIVEY
jgi:hypothetical protein